MEWLKKIPMSVPVLDLMFGGFHQRFYGKERMRQEDRGLVRRFVGVFDEWQGGKIGVCSKRRQVTGLNHMIFGWIVYFFWRG
jgi:hypothetical protein